jgi:hypothetical protein
MHHLKNMNQAFIKKHSENVVSVSAPLEKGGEMQKV